MCVACTHVSVCVCVGSTHERMHVASMRVRFCLRAKCVYLSTGVSKPGAGEEQEEERRRGAGEKRRGEEEERRRGGRQRDQGQSPLY